MIKDKNKKKLFIFFRMMINLAIILFAIVYVFHYSSNILTFDSSTSLASEILPYLLILILLIILIVFQFYRLAKKRNKKVFGSKLAIKIVLLFSFVAIIPGVMVFIVSNKYITNSFDSWFDERVEKALESGINLGKDDLDTSLKNLFELANEISYELSVESKDKTPKLLSEFREKKDLDEISLLSQNGEPQIFISKDPDYLIPNKISDDILFQYKANGTYSKIEEDEKNYSIRVLVPVIGEKGADQILHLVVKSTESFHSILNNIYFAFQDYKSLILSKESLKSIYFLALVMALTIGLLTAVFLAVIFSKQISQPLEYLMHGTEAVGKGDFTKRDILSINNELGYLIKSFNDMTVKLFNTQEDVKNKQNALIDANSNLENVLSNISTGVIWLDEDYNLKVANKSAGKILGESPDFSISEKITDLKINPLWLQPIIKISNDFFNLKNQTDFEKKISIDPKNNQVILIKGKKLSFPNKSFLIVFDDITDVLKNEKYAAWGEIARRLAHEIKNPLTPIQLSAEFIKSKLQGKLKKEDFIFLEKFTDNIGTQVNAMKKMLDAFNDFARSPQTILQKIDLVKEINNISSLYVSSKNITFNNKQNYPIFILGDSIKIKQLLHNLIKNAEESSNDIKRSSQVLVELISEEGFVSISVVDNGVGFPEEMGDKIFDPYVTTKQQGTGLGLAIVKKIIDEHNGKIILKNRKVGSEVLIKFPLV